MEFLSEDPTYLAGALGLLGFGFLIALKLTQQGKYLLRAGIALALALVVVGVERVWVTDNERIEHTLYALSQAVAASDADAALELLTPDAEVKSNLMSRSGPETRAMLRSLLSNAKFDFLRIHHVQTNAGEQSRRGTAEFIVMAGGSYQTPYSRLNFGTHNSSWSLGLKETEPGLWKVCRITPVRVPDAQYVLGESGGGGGGGSGGGSGGFRGPRGFREGRGRF